MPSSGIDLRIDGGAPVLQEILAGGQTFLWTAESPGTWRGVHRNFAYEVRLSHGDSLEVNCLNPRPDFSTHGIQEFFATSTPFSTIADNLPWRSDPILADAMRGLSGLRILRQPPEVALLAFLLSPQKRIEQIRRSLLAITARWGTPLTPDLAAPPSWACLAQVDETDLRSCGIGYRAKSIAKTARKLAAEPGFLDHIENLPTPQAREQLQTLPGVGRKIADCVLLFGYGRLESFPIDTWIGRFMRDSYQLHEYTDEQIQAFARAHFGPHAGFAQQFIFAAARSRPSLNL